MDIIGTQKKTVLSVCCFVGFVFIFFLIFNKGLFHYLYPFNKGIRIETIKECDVVFQKTNQYLLREEYMPDNKGDYIKLFRPVDYVGDDVGIYFYVIYVKKLFNIKSVENAYMLLFFLIIVVSYAISLIGVNLLFKDRNVKTIASILLGLFSFFCLFIMDVYSLSYLAVSFVPLYLFLIKEFNEISMFKLLLFAAVLGFIIGFANIFRNHAGTSVLLFVVFSLVLNIDKFNWKKIIVITLTLLLFSQIEKLHFSMLKSNRNEWMNKNQESKDEIRKESTHVIWHSLYLGLAFVPSEYGIKFSDSFGFNKAKEINKNLYVNYNNESDEYEEIIKNEFFKILNNDPFFIIKTIALKLYYSILLLLLSFNVGLLLIFKVKLPLKFLLPFIVTISFCTLPAILVWPFPMYFLGALAFTLILCLIYINEWIERRVNLDS